MVAGLATIVVVPTVIDDGDENNGGCELYGGSNGSDVGEEVVEEVDEKEKGI